MKRELKNLCKYLLVMIALVIFYFSSVMIWYSVLWYLPVIISGWIIMSFIYVNFEYDDEEE